MTDITDTHEAIAKAIEAKCIELIDQKATDALASVTTDVIEAPMIPSFGDKKPVTMRELLGLYGHEYLTTTVDRDGKAARHDGWLSPPLTRIEHIVQRILDRKFADEIKKATDGVITGIKAAVRARHDAVLSAEKQRVAEALSVLAANNKK